MWSIYNGATYYIDVFGKRFQNELEALKKDVAKWQTSPDMGGSPTILAKLDEAGVNRDLAPLSMGTPVDLEGNVKGYSFEKIPMLDSRTVQASGLDMRGMDGGSADVVRERATTPAVTPAATS